MCVTAGVCLVGFVVSVPFVTEVRIHHSKTCLFDWGLVSEHIWPSQQNIIPVNRRNDVGYKIAQKDLWNRNLTHSYHDYRTYIMTDSYIVYKIVYRVASMINMLRWMPKEDLCNGMTKLELY